MKPILKELKCHINFISIVIFLLISTFNSSLYAEDNRIKIKKDEEYVISLVQKASKYISMYGREKALEEFNKKSGIFNKDSYYVFALDYEGTVLANMNNPTWIGTNQINLQNSEGVYLVKEEIDKAKQGGGWLIGRKKKHPLTGKLECKKSYIQPIKGDYFIGSGYYYPAEAQGKCP